MQCGVQAGHRQCPNHSACWLQSAEVGHSAMAVGLEFAALQLRNCCAARRWGWVLSRAGEGSLRPNLCLENSPAAQPMGALSLQAALPGLQSPEVLPDHPLHAPVGVMVVLPSPGRCGMQGMNGPAYHPTLGCRVGAHGHGCPPVLGCKGCVVTPCAGMQRRCTPPYSLPRFHAAERQHDPAGPPGMQRYGGDTARSPLPAVTQRASGSSERYRGGEGGHSAAGRGWRLCPPPSVRCQPGITCRSRSPSMPSSRYGSRSGSGSGCGSGSGWGCPGRMLSP